MDVDMIVTRDISELWKTDISHHIIAAVTDSTAVYIKNNVKNYRELNLPGDAKYFNSGLLLINTQKWRDEDLSRKVIHTVNANRKHTEFSDQYGLNVNLVNKWLELDPLWNYYANGTHPAPYNIHFFHRKPFYKSLTVKNFRRYSTVMWRRQTGRIVSLSVNSNDTWLKQEILLKKYPYCLNTDTN